MILTMKKMLCILFFLFSISAFAQVHCPNGLKEFWSQNKIFHVERKAIGESNDLKLYTAIYTSNNGEKFGCVGFVMPYVQAVSTPGFWSGFNTSEEEIGRGEYLLNDWEIPMIMEYLEWMQGIWLSSKQDGEYTLIIPDGLTLSLDTDDMLVSLDDENDLVARYDSLKLVVASNLNKKDLAELLSLFTKAQDVLKDRMGE